MFQRLRKLLDLNSNGKVEIWEMAIFAIGFIVAGIFLNSLV